MSDYEVIWDGSKTHNRGYLCVPADVPRPPDPVPREVWSERDPHPLSILARVTNILRTAKQTSVELQVALNKQQTPIGAALAELKRRGTLRSAPIPHSRALLYWID